MIPSFKYCIFDLDGTLVDSAPGVDYAAQVAWAEVQPDRACPPMRPLMGPPIRVMFERALHSASQEVLDRLERSFRHAYDAQGWKETAVFAGVLESLAELQMAGVELFGVTNKPALPSQRILIHCGLACFFRKFLSPDSHQPPFTSKSEAIRSILQECQLNPHLTCLIGDTVEDANAARASGVAFIGYLAGYGSSRLDLSELDVFSDFAALPGLLRSGRRFTVRQATHHELRS